MIATEPQGRTDVADRRHAGARRVFQRARLPRVESSRHFRPARCPPARQRHSGDVRARLGHYRFGEQVRDVGARHQHDGVRGAQQRRRATGFGSRRIMTRSLMLALGASVLLAGLGFWCSCRRWDRGSAWDPELVRATAVTLLALPGIALYRVANGLSRGMTVMHHDIYSRGLTESLATAAALVVAVGVRLCGSSRRKRPSSPARSRPAASRLPLRGDCMCLARARLPKRPLGPRPDAPSRVGADRLIRPDQHRRDADRRDHARPVRRLRCLDSRWRPSAFMPPASKWPPAFARSVRSSRRFSRRLSRGRSRRGR